MDQSSLQIIPVPDQDLVAVRGRGLCGPFPRHAHRCLVLGLVDEGRRRIDLGHEIFTAGPDEVFVLAPHQGHRCASGNSQGHSYRVLCLPEGAVPMLEALATPLVRCPRARELFEAFFALLPPAPKTLARREELLTELLLLACAHGRPAEASVAREADGQAMHPGIAAALAALTEAPEEGLSLDELAELAHLSKFHFQRLFVAQTGMSPADCALHCRIRRALTLIARGMPLAEAGLACGFADQSHFTKAFRKSVGVPPGRFLRHNPPLADAKG